MQSELPSSVTLAQPSSGTFRTFGGHVGFGRTRGLDGVRIVSPDNGPKLPMLKPW